MSPEHELPLFLMHRASDPETSRQAAARVRDKLTPLQQRVLVAVAGCGRRGANGRELETLPAFADCGPSTVRKRLSELAKAGEVVEHGRRDGMTVYVHRTCNQVRSA